MTPKKTISCDFNPSPETPSAAIVKSFFEAAVKGDAAQVADCLGMYPVLADWREPVLKQTALILAAQEGHPAVVEALLTAGADIQAEDAGAMTAIHQAAAHGHFEVCDILIRAGADPEARGRHYISAVACAVAADFPSLGDHMKRTAEEYRDIIRNSWRGADAGGMELDHAIPVMKRLSLKPKGP